MKKNKDYFRQYRHENYTGIYGSWYAMKQRCSNANHKQYKDYGGRGIAFDSRWSEFKNFKQDMQEGYQKGLTIERIDNNKGYFKENCKWVTRKEQGNNKRCNHIIEFQGQKRTLSQWADQIGISFGTIRSRFYRGMKANEILKSNLYRPAKLFK